MPWSSPHIKNAAHAAVVCGYAKFPPRGDRSFAGGRTVGYGAPDDAWVVAQDAKTRCYPMIEHGTALAEVEAILALDVVDGVFVGTVRSVAAPGAGAPTSARRATSPISIGSQRPHTPSASIGSCRPGASTKRRSLTRTAAHAMVLTMEHGALALGLRDAWNAMGAIAAQG